MKKAIFIIIIGISISNELFAQADTSRIAKGKRQVISLGINIPLNEFSQTYFGGISLNYSWSHHRFGKISVLPKKLIGFTADGGADYYFGKKETVSGYDFKYARYVYLHVFGGAIYNPCKEGSIVLTTGPTLGIYKGNTDLGFGVNLNGSYYFNDRIAITPGVIYMKHNKTNSLWAISLKATYNLQ